MITDDRQSGVAAVPQGVDDAVGVPRGKWFVAIVNSRHEKTVAEKLEALGLRAYVAAQKEMRVWKNGRRKIVDRVVIPSVVFVHCTEKTRREIVNLPYIFRFMVNRSADSGALNKPVAVIPDKEIEKLKFMLGQSDVPVEFVDHEYSGGDRVRVSRGSLTGLEGVVLRAESGTRDLIVSLNLLGSAKVRISVEDLEPLAG